MVDIERKVKDIVMDQLSVADYDQDKADLKGEYSLVDDLGADSLDIVELIMRFEEEFDISISEEDLNTNHIDTINDAIELVKNKIPQNK